MTINVNCFSRQDSLVSVHKWATQNEKGKYSGTKSTLSKNEANRDSAWGPFFKDRKQFNEMHMF